MEQGKKGNLQAQLSLQLDKNGLLRCHRRFSLSDLTQGAKEPKLLPKREYFTKLVVEHYHQKILHSGVSQTLAQTCQEYLIPQRCALVKQTLKNCQICKELKEVPLRFLKCHRCHESKLPGHCRLSLQVLTIWATLHQTVCTSVR